jgi:capsular polysaccharide transport system permease protein
MGAVVAGWLLYGMFTLALCLILAPLSELSEVLEKIMPVTTYIMIPFSGAFNMVSWLTPEAQNFMYYSPFVQAMELMRHGIFGERINAQWDVSVPIFASIFLSVIGLSMCRSVRKRLVIE